MKNLFYLLIAALIFGVVACDEDDHISPQAQGFLQLGVAIAIEEDAGGRVESVNTDDFRVTIFNIDSTVALDIPRFVDAPDSISLASGEYFAEASSNNLANAAFESPFYFGRTSSFTIAKEEAKSVSIDTELANVQVSFVFSQNVIQDFDLYEGIAKLQTTNDSLFYATGETRSGYFITDPLDISARLRFQKTDGTVLERIFIGSIANPQPRTHYRINVDALLENGRIGLIINVDEGVNIEEIDLSAPIPTFQKTFGGSQIDQANSIVQTQDGGFIIAGETISTDGDVSENLGLNDFWVVKTDANGGLEWERSAGGTGSDFATQVTQSFDGSYGVIGTSNSSTDPFGNTGNNGLNDAYFVKLSSSGNIVGKKMIGGGLNDQGHSISPTADGGYVIGGAAGSGNGDFSVNRGNFDLFVAELSPVQFGFTAIDRLTSLGGSQFENAESVMQTADGGYIVAGRTSSIDGDVIGANGGVQDFWILKLDRFLTISWQRTYGGFDVDIAYEIKQTTDDGYIVAGSTKSANGDVINNQGDFDYWVVKLNSLGNIQWQKTFGGSGEDQARSVDQTTDGGYVVSGHSNSTDGDVVGNHGASDFWIIKLSGTGDLQWNKSLGGSAEDRSFSIQQTDDEGFITAGFTTSSDGDVTNSKGSTDIWIVKLDQNGNLKP